MRTRSRHSAPGAEHHPRRGVPRPASGWEILDLHNHSFRSYDAFNRLEHYERAHAAGRFSALGITDHNRIDGAVELAKRASFPVIVGEEIDTSDGELIGLFLQAVVPPRLPATETAQQIRAQGGLVYLQHPFYRLVRQPLGAAARAELARARLIDIVEGLNGGPFTPTFDARARAWAVAHDLPLGAGSDAHEPMGIGCCGVAVPPGPLEPASLPERLREGMLIDHRRASVLQICAKAQYRFFGAIPRRLRGEPRRRRLDG